MIIEPMKSEGGWVCSDIIDGEYIKRRFIGYTKAEARFFFKEFVRELKKSR